MNVTRSHSALLSANFTPLMSKTKSDFQRWNNLPLTLAGRINTIKMFVLPEFLYPFHSIPLYLPKSFFKSLNKLITTFIWAGKHPRISILQHVNWLEALHFQIFYIIIGLLISTNCYSGFIQLTPPGAQLKPNHVLHLLSLLSYVHHIQSLYLYMRITQLSYLPLKSGINFGATLHSLLSQH